MFEEFNPSYVKLKTSIVESIRKLEIEDIHNCAYKREELLQIIHFAKKVPEDYQIRNVLSKAYLATGYKIENFKSEKNSCDNQILYVDENEDIQN